MSHRPGRLRPLLTDGQVLSNPDSIRLLGGVADGRITRTNPGVTTGYLCNGNQIGRLALAGPSDQELISLPISGPPQIAPRGSRLLATARAKTRP